MMKKFKVKTLSGDWIKGKFNQGKLEFETEVDLGNIDFNTLCNYVTQLSNGEDIYEYDQVIYQNYHHCYIKYFEDYCIYGLALDKSFHNPGKIMIKDWNLPLGKSGSSTKYAPYLLNKYHLHRTKLTGQNLFD